MDKKPAKKIMEEENYFMFTGRKLPAIGAYPFDIWGERCGDPVKFHSFLIKDGKIELDQFNLPMIEIVINNGIETFSSGYFE